jgi:hypothetical protein
MMIEVELIPGGCRLPGGQVLPIRDRGEIARLLLANGMDSRARLVIRSGLRVIADDLLGVVSGQPVVCGDVDVIERD